MFISYLFINYPGTTFLALLALIFVISAYTYLFPRCDKKLLHLNQRFDHFVGIDFWIQHIITMLISMFAVLVVSLFLGDLLVSQKLFTIFNYFAALTTLGTYYLIDRNLKSQLQTLPDVTSKNIAIYRLLNWACGLGFIIFFISMGHAIMPVIFSYLLQF